MPSFDSKPVSKSSTVKRAKLQGIGSSISSISDVYDIVPKRKSTSSLSALLKACEPQKPSELVVSRQKQQDILAWLQLKVKKGRPCALILSGASGCGKTAAIRLLAKENDFDVTEWITPIDQVMDENSNLFCTK